MAFEVSRPLRFGDCDPAGIAYFPSYLDTLVGVVEEFFAAVGAPWPTLHHERGLAVPTVRLDLTFVRPGLHGDVMVFALKVMAVGGSSLDLVHEVRVGETLIWSATQRLVATSTTTKKAMRWPEDIRAGLMAHLEPAAV